jgi:hypothetical protein
MRFPRESKTRRPLVAILLVIIGAASVKVTEGALDGFPILKAVVQTLLGDSTSLDSSEPKLPEVKED